MPVNADAITCARGLSSRPRPGKEFASDAALLGAYAALVFALLGLTPLWLDEIQQLGNAWRQTAAHFWTWLEISPGAVPLPACIQQVALSIFGHSAFAARIPAACFSILAAGVFALVCRRVGIRKRLVALALFLLIPVQFRYALEARGYSQGLFFTVLTLWIFLALRERPSMRKSLAYGLAIALGMYSQPFTLFPVAGQFLGMWTKQTTRAARIYATAAMGAGVLSYAPWWWLQKRALETFPAEHDVFSPAQIRPLVLLHDFAGGGYVCTLCVLALIAAGLLRSASNVPKRLLVSTFPKRLFVSMALVSIAGPILADALFSYFFANRQLLFAIPAVLLLAAEGVDAAWTRWPAGVSILLACFFIAAGITDRRDATVPKDDLARTSGAIASRLPGGACVIAAPPREIAYYVFFHPEMEAQVCREPLRSDEVITVSSDNWSSPQDRRQLQQEIESAYRREGGEVLGHVTLQIYRRK